MESFKGTVAVVTGGGSGIGRALALSLAREGARVVVADLDEAAMDGVVREARGHGVDALAVRTDVTDLPQVEGPGRARVAGVRCGPRALQQRRRRHVGRAREGHAP